MFDLDLDGIDEVGRLADFVPVWLDVRVPRLAAEALAEDASLRLEDETTGPDGQQWEAWSDDYAKTRTASDKLLYDSGDLAEGLEVRTRGDRSEVTSDQPYAPKHQFGGLRDRTPARPYIGVSSDFEPAFSDILNADLARGFGRG